MATLSDSRRDIAGAGGTAGAAAGIARPGGGPGPPGGPPPPGGMPNGFEAFEMVKNKQYDLIVLDLNMPIMNGYQAANKITTFYEKNFLF